MDEPEMSTEAQVVEWLAGQAIDAYLVGGWVRDRWLGRPRYDMDVAVAGDGLVLARWLANRFQGAYYPLDTVRSTGRAILSDEDGHRIIVDVARLRGADLLADLADRDFTINAMAANVHAPDEVIDQHGGIADLEAGLIRPVSEGAIRNDPLRALRAVRQAAELGFVLAAETEALIRRDGQELVEVAGERVRDELARILAADSAAPQLVYLDLLGLLTIIFPELAPLRDLAQPPPHHLEALAHSLETVHDLERILAALSAEVELGEVAPTAAQEHDELAALRPFAGRLGCHLDQMLDLSRSRRVTLKLAALLHDVGKPATRSEDDQGRVRFLGHHRCGVKAAGQALRRLRFNNLEIRLAETVVDHHMRPLLLANQQSVSPRAIFRFFRDCGGAGVDLLLHALADHRATYGVDVDDDRWPRLVALTARMLGAYWERLDDRVAPPRLIDGRDLQDVLALQPGPEIGYLLDAVREAQIVGQIHSREEALALARWLLDQGDPEPGA